jgi:hypothetical protein
MKLSQILDHIADNVDDEGDDHEIVPDFNEVITFLQNHPEYDKDVATDDK